MASRAELVLRAGAVNVNHTNYPNDSNLEQAVIYAEKAVTTTTTATQILAPADAVHRQSGDANI